jgi:MFS family permease
VRGLQPQIAGQCELGTTADRIAVLAAGRYPVSAYPPGMRTFFTLVVPIQSKLPELLNASREDTAWVVTATLLAAAVFTPIAGRLGDMYGKRRIVLEAAAEHMDRLHQLLCVWQFPFGVALGSQHQAQDA